jgi:DNA-damage-inducible protein D
MVELNKEVRTAIQRIGGTMPEDLPPVEHIKQLENRLKSTPAKLKLEDKEAKGLAGSEESK